MSVYPSQQSKKIVAAHVRPPLTAAIFISSLSLIVAVGVTAVTIETPSVQSNRRISRVVEVHRIRRVIEVESPQSSHRVTSVTIEIPSVQSNRRISRVVEVHRIIMLNYAKLC